MLFFLAFFVLLRNRFSFWGFWFLFGSVGWGGGDRVGLAGSTALAR
jgi:hypothetical protein